MCDWIEQLSPEFFWDVDRTQVQTDIHMRWLLERVLQRGRWEDWILVRDHLGKETIRKSAASLRLDDKSKNFLNLYLAS
jgi:hypothetical protein